MKTKISYQFRQRHFKVTFFKIVIVGILMLSLNSCSKSYWGYDGFDGRAYLALSWSEAEPEYIEPGTFAIPQYFYWNEYYRIEPGIYNMYYDGSLWDGYGWLDYAWEVDYEIWVNYGEPGGPYYDGRDGLDNYFVIECNPFGPFVYRDLKSGSVNPKYEIIESNEDNISIIMSNEYFSMKLNYRKVEKRTGVQQKALN